MTGLILVVSFIWVFPSIYQAFDIPIEAALLVKGAPVGFSAPLRRHKRAQGGNGTISCKDDEYYLKKKNYCCNLCLAGYSVHSDCLGHGLKTWCDPCPNGTYTAKPNKEEKCQPCNRCLFQYGQIQLSRCERHKDVECGCPEGQFKSKQEKFYFKCLDCSKCKNGTELVKCNDANDTICQCFNGFFFDKESRNCRPCVECDSPDCIHHCKDPRAVMSPTPQDHKVPLMAVGISLAVALLCMVAYVIWMHRKRISTYLQNKTCSSPALIEGTIVQSTPLMEGTVLTHASQPLPGYTACAIDNPHIVQQSARQISTQSAPQSLTFELPDVTLHTAAPCLQSPEVQYKIIESIPVFRWREFVRRLGLSNYAIETTEKDYSPYKDAQYAMLGIWINSVGSSGATRDLLFRVLRDMDLGGCVERIEECL